MYDSKILKEDINRILENRELFETLKGSVILVTGATGMIGSMMIRVLAAENDLHAADIRIIGQVRNEDKAGEVLGSLADRRDVELIFSESFDFYPDCDYIIHTACPTASRYYVEHPVETIDFSLQSTRKLLALAAQNQVKGMVYLSSMEEYGEPYAAGQIMSEDDCGFIDHLRIRSCYPESKRMCECYCASYAAEYGVKVMIARLAQTFGAGVPLTDHRVFMQFAESVIEGRDLVLHTEGKSVSNFCYLSDAIEGILTILLSGTPGEAYNVCNDEESRTIRETADLIADEFGEGKMKVIVDIPESDMAYGYASDVTMRLCSAKLCAQGWKAKVSMAEAYKRLIDYINDCLE